MIRLIGCGRTLGSKVESNDEVASRLGIDSSEILEKTGIKQRYIEPELSASAMALDSLKQALCSAKLEAEDLDGIIVATFSADYKFPNLASHLARDLNIKDCFCFDVQANCAGFQMAMIQARNFLLTSPNMRCVAVVGVAKQSPYLDPYNPDTALYFSDAASSVILVHDRENPAVGLGESIFRTHGKNYEYVRLRAGGSSFPLTPNLISNDPKALYYEHAGLGVWTEVMAEMPRLIRKLLDTKGWQESEVQAFFFHQANYNLLNFILKRLGASVDKAWINVTEIGNTADASLGTVLYDAFQAGYFQQSGQKMILASVGAGFVYCATTYES